MLANTVPVKTPLGQQELRLRTGGLGQRHRTLLFLIDGQRPLSEVLSLAHQAGASTRHFEDLVHQGFVEMPMPQVAADEHSAPITEPGALAADAPEPPPVVTSVDLEVPAAVVMVMPEPQAEPPLPVASVPAPASAPPAPPAAPAAAPRPSPAILERLASMRQRKAQRPPPEPLEEARECLLKVIKLDRTVAARQARSRVVNAKAEALLIDVVWYLERDLSHGQRSHAGLLALQRARELLRLGNTLVQEAIEAGVIDAP